MKTTLLLAVVASAVAVAGAAFAQNGRPITQQDIATAQALYEQMKPACAGGSPKKACGVLAYSPEDCDGKEKDAHIRQVYATYDDRTVRFQQGNNGVARNRPMALLAPFGIIGRNGVSTPYANPQFVSWDEYQGGKKSVTVCGKNAKIEAKDFFLAHTIEDFLKKNP